MSENASVASAFIDQLRAAGVRWIFGNPGTTEQGLLDELQDHEDIDLVLALHEGVAVTAAEGYARASGEVGVIQVHGGPGLGNAMGMLYNASVGHTPLVVYVGQAPFSSLHQDPLLSIDFPAMAAPLAKWTYEIRTPGELPLILRRAVKVATTPPCGPVVIVVSMDLLNMECVSPVLPPSPVLADLRPDRLAITRAAEILRDATSPAIVVGDGLATAGGSDALRAVAQLLGAPIFGGWLSECVVSPDEPLKAGRLPFAAKGIDAVLGGYDCVLAVGTKVLPQLLTLDGPPLGDRSVVHIGLDPWELAKNQPSAVVFGQERVSLQELLVELESVLDDDPRAVWRERRDRETQKIAAARVRVLEQDASRWDLEPMSAERAMSELASVVTPDVCLVDESVSNYGIVERYLRQDVGNWFRGRGGGIGAGMALPIGVQLARPDQTVVCITGDGSAMYSISALWTAAHHRLPIVWIILDNGSYRLIKLNTLEFSPADRSAARGFVGADLNEPPLNFVALAAGMGLPAQRVTHPAEIAPAVKQAMSNREGPSLIQLVVNGDI